MAVDFFHWGLQGIIIMDLSDLPQGFKDFFGITEDQYGNIKLLEDIEKIKEEL